VDRGGRPVGRSGLAGAARWLLRAGATLAVLAMVVPGVAAALGLAGLAALDTFMGHPQTLEGRTALLTYAAVLFLASATWAFLLWRGLKGDSVALALVAVGGVAWTLVGLRGLQDATGYDLMWLLALGGVLTGALLAVGAPLSLVVGWRSAAWRIR
jgi:hypothetical protein